MKRVGSLQALASMSGWVPSAHWGYPPATAPPGVAPHAPGPITPAAPVVVTPPYPGGWPQWSSQGINVVGCVCCNRWVQFVTLFGSFTFTGHVKNVYIQGLYLYKNSPSQKGHRNCQVYKIHVIYIVIFCQLRPGQVPYQAPPQASILEASGDVR